MYICMQTSGTCTLLHLSFYSHVRLLDRLQWLVREGYDINLNDKVSAYLFLYFCIPIYMYVWIQKNTNIYLHTCVYICVDKQATHKSPLHFSLTENCEEKVIDFLIAHGANVNAKDNVSHTHTFHVYMHMCVSVMRHVYMHMPVCVF